MDYNPESPADRRSLAQELQLLFQRSAFQLVSNSSTEEIYELEIPQLPGTRIAVMSSIFNGEVRDCGADAIRVQAMFKTRTGRDKILFTARAVHRTGDVTKIVARVRTRMRETYAEIRDRDRAGMRCRSCNAPFFKAKSGKNVCANICWENK